jgi:hypothetical protein
MCFGNKVNVQRCVFTKCNSLMVLPQWNESQPTSMTMAASFHKSNTEHGLFHILYVFAVLSPVYPHGHASMVNRAYK